MAIIVPGTTEMDEAVDPLNLAITLAETLGVELTDTTAELAAAKIAAALEATGVTPRETLLAALLPADAPNRLALIEALFASVTGTVAPASGAQIRAATAGLYLVTPAGLKDAKAMQTLTVTADVIPVDGNAYWRGTAVITDDAAIDEAVNLGNDPLTLFVIASGGDREVTPHESYVRRGVDGPVTIVSGKTGKFTIEKVGETVELTTEGAQESEVIITRLTPVLANPSTARGSNTGAAISTHPAGFAIVFDTRDDNTGATALGGSWTSRAAWTNTTGDNNLSGRISTKVVTENEGIPASTSGSRRSVRIYTDYATDQDPFVDIETAGGKGANATVPFASLSFLLDEDTNPIPELVVGFAKRAGTGTFTWAEPTAADPHNQNTTGVAGSADSGTARTSAADLVMATGTNNNWLAAGVLLLGAIDE